MFLKPVPIQVLKTSLVIITNTCVFSVFKTKCEIKCHNELFFLTSSEEFVLIAENFWQIFWHDNWQSIISAVENFRYIIQIVFRWFLNEFMKSSFLPKCQPEIWRISALPSNKLPEQKSFKFWLAFWEKRWPHEFILNFTDL